MSNAKNPSFRIECIQRFLLNESCAHWNNDLLKQPSHSTSWYWLLKRYAKAVMDLRLESHNALPPNERHPVDERVPWSQASRHNDDVYSAGESIIPTWLRRFHRESNERSWGNPPFTWGRLRVRLSKRWLDVLPKTKVKAILFPENQHWFSIHNSYLILRLTLGCNANPTTCTKKEDTHN